MRVRTYGNTVKTDSIERLLNMRVKFPNDDSNYHGQDDKRCKQSVEYRQPFKQLYEKYSL
jgi:hypothetical protein